MINLLPKEYKDNIVFDKRKRVIFSFCFLIFYFFISLILALLLIKFYLHSKTEPQKIYLEEKRENLRKEETEIFLNKVKETNSVLGKINSFYANKKYYGEIIEKIYETVPSGITLNNISISRSVEKDSDIVSVSLTGSSLNAESLINFKDNLKKEEFKDLYIPQSNWINPENFSISFKL